MPRALFVLALSMAIASHASPTSAQTTPPTPATQTDRLTQILGLGDAFGCLELLYPDQAQRSLKTQLDVANDLASLGTQFGNELRAICGPSAVNSSSSLGGGLGTTQPTKSSTQFAVPRGRIDQRLRTGTMTKPRRVLRMAAFGQLQPSPSLSSLDTLADGVAVFGSVEFDRRDRADTPFEGAYESDIKGFSGGLDFVRGHGIVGGFAGRSEQNADFTRFAPILAGTSAAQDFGLFQREPDKLTLICGGLTTAGRFEQTSTRVGGFAGWGVGGPGFVDATVAWTRREQDYARNVCAIEGSNEIVFTNGEFRSGTTVLDDIFAGTLSGNNTTRETALSIRTGANLGNDTVLIGPRVTLTMARATTDAYAETGVSTVANTVDPNEGDDVIRRLGGPIGFELAFDEQSRTSVVLEAGSEFAVRLGPIVPFVSGYWRRELKDDFHTVTARFVQDRRPTPSVFEFGNDPFDRDSLVTGFGVSAVGGNRFMARLEVTKLHADDLFNSRTIALQARVRF
jgi:uncharacterized protein YhjY with autotransporter beta-barrel domain